VLSPALLLADEPVSMLDVSVRAGVLSLLDGLRRDGDMGVLMITHDLSTAAHFADRIAVMYLGRIVEQGRPRTWSATRSTRTPRRCCPWCPSPTHGSAAPRRSCRRDAESGQRARGLPVPPTLPDRRGQVRDRGPGAS
jgi:ABC-type dipeptide/oligopeptide/nickel transport system ATPase component